MFAIRFSPAAERNLKAVPTPKRELCTKLLKAMAELAEIYPAEHAVWDRLGTRRPEALEVEVEEATLRLAVDAEQRVLRVLRVQSASARRKKLISPVGRKTATFAAVG